MSYTISKLIPEDELREGIKKVAERINKDYGDKEVHLVCVLKGGVYFLTELSKYLNDNIVSELNYQVDNLHMKPEDVAKKFIKKHNLI